MALELDLTEDLNVWVDTLNESDMILNSSLVTPYTQAGNLAYIRRYVNDVER